MNESTVNEISIKYGNNIPVNKYPKLTSPNAVYQTMKQVYDKDMIFHHEEFWIALLDIKNKVLGISKIAQGGISEVYIDIRIIFQLALKTNAVAIILSHNHPSNEPHPSSRDMVLTQQVIEAGKLLNITIIDHLIICEDGYYSFANEGML
jgi:DNA repair protein RadC